MSYRPFSPYSPPMEQYPTCFTTGSYSSQSGPSRLSPISHPHAETSFSELQSFCNTARESFHSSSAYRDVGSPMNYSCGNSSSNCDYYPQQIQHTQYLNNNSMEDVEDKDDDGADWFDLEGLGLTDCDFSGERFEFPVPTEPVSPINELRTETFSGQNFYINDEDFVQVYTHGECYNPFFDKPSIGVYFGPDHPSNVSEKLHRGRRTQEAARFAAIIEAIRVAGSYGVKKLQINTDYINVIRFMMFFIFKWEHNGWMTIKGTPVKNQTLIRELDYFSSLLEIKWNYVPWEDKVEGNLEATRLAKEALELEIPSSFSEKSVTPSTEENVTFVPSDLFSPAVTPKHPPISFF